MISNSVSIKIVDSPEEAPNYTNDTMLLKMKRCIIVGKGTIKGNPTIDIQLTDDSGKKYVIMTTGAIITGISEAVKGKKQRDLN